MVVSNKHYKKSTTILKRHLSKRETSKRQRSKSSKNYDSKKCLKCNFEHCKCKHSKLSSEHKGGVIFFRNLFKATPRNSTPPEVRFQNCAILKLSIRKNSDITLDLVYKGEFKRTTKNTDKLYYVLNSEQLDSQLYGSLAVPSVVGLKNYMLCTHNTRIRCFVDKFFKVEGSAEITNEEHKTVEFKMRTCKQKTLLQDSSIINEVNADIYIMRHGDAEHNAIVGFFPKLKQTTPLGIRDTTLTENGIKQATKAGTSSNVSTIKFDKIFASKLKRTRETINMFFSTVNNDINKDDTSIYILPCANELQNFNHKGCSENGIIVAPENKSSCNCANQNIQSCNSNTEKHCTEQGKYKLNWELYNTKPKEICNTSNMIQILLEFAKQIDATAKVALL